MTTLKEVRDSIESLLRDERGEDGTYETKAIEVEVIDLEAWRDALTAALGNAEPKPLPPDYWETAQ